MRNKVSIFLLTFVLVAGIYFPAASSAHAQLQMSDLAPALQATDVTAASVVVINQVTGETVYGRSEDAVRVPASLTKLLMTLTMLDIGYAPARLCAITSEDEVGGARLASREGAKYRMDDLLKATLVASANNAASALADCTGLSRADFVARMNDKAKSLGATNSTFVDPSGMSELSHTTASDMAKIAQAAFSTAKVRDISRLQKAYFCSKTRPVKCHTLTNTNILLKDTGIKMIAGKTGYLDESLYNFTGSFRDPATGNYYVAVVLGSSTRLGNFAEFKKVAQYVTQKAAWDKNFASANLGSAVLGVTNP